MTEGKNKLFILGTIHRDRNGPQMLLPWLEHIMPHVITLEFSHYGLFFRKRYAKEYKKRINEVLDKVKMDKREYNAENVADLFSYVDLPYEYRISLQYVKKNSGLLYLIDPDIFSYLKLRNSEELFHPSNIEKVMYNNDCNDWKNAKAIAKLFFEGGIKITPYSKEMYTRDRYMSDKISILMRSCNNKRFLHICGWQHMEDPCKLFSRFNPEKVFIYDKIVRI